MSHKNPVPVTIGIIPSLIEGHLLLIERTDGGLALPGGYVDELEDSATALTREVLEEMGLALDASRWKLFHSATTTDNKLLLFSSYPERVALPTGFIRNDEVLVVLSAPFATPLKFPLHEAAIRQWQGSPCSHGA